MDAPELTSRKVLFQLGYKIPYNYGNFFYTYTPSNVLTIQYNKKYMELEGSLLFSNSPTIKTNELLKSVWFLRLSLLLVVVVNGFRISMMN
jgi:hypothetical protein